jgi:fatty acid desaturase
MDNPSIPNTVPQSIGDEVPRNYRELLKKANLSADELKELGRLHAGRPIYDFLVTLFLMASAPLVFAISPGVITGLLCVFLALHNFNRLASLVHASDHGYLFQSARANNALGNFCAYLMGYTRSGHRLAHQAHHSFLNTEGDTDKVWSRPAESARATAKKWLQDFFLMSAIRRLLQYAQADKKQFTVSPWQRMSFRFVFGALIVQAPVIPVQLGLLCFYWWIAGPYYYFVFHALLLVTVYPALIRLRSTTEHSFPAGYSPADTEQRWVARSTDANWFERFVIAPLDGHYHFEHHLLPGIPYYNLRRAHFLIQEKGLRVPTAPGYFGYFFDKWRQERLALAAQGS